MVVPVDQDMSFSKLEPVSGLNNSGHNIPANSNTLELINRRLTKEFISKAERSPDIDPNRQTPATTAGQMNVQADTESEVTQRPKRQVASRADIYSIQREAYLEHLETEYRKPYDEAMAKLNADKEELRLLEQVRSLKQAVAAVIETDQIRKQTKEQAISLTTLVCQG